jgi:hypothetical protein
MSIREDVACNEVPVNSIRLMLIGGVTLAAIIAVAFVPRVPQSEAYHNFADQRSLFGIDNCLNVISNIAFLVVGISGLFVITSTRSRNSFVQSWERPHYVVFFVGVTLTCFGSAYYHLAPNTERLMWDRLPMTIAFMSLLTAVITERINLKAGGALLLPLLSIGAASVVYWHMTEQSGNGDLRPYILVQFLSGLVIVLVVVMFPSGYTRNAGLPAALILYALAKIFELLDSTFYNLGQIISGHTLKHLSAALSVWFILRMLRHRTPTAVASMRGSAGILSAS